MGLINKLGEYFIGTETIRYYNESSNEHPEKAQKYKKERNNCIIKGKIIPDLLDLSGLTLACFREYLFGAMIIGIGEGIRDNHKINIQEKKLENAHYYFNKEADELDKLLKEKIDKKSKI